MEELRCDGCGQRFGSVGALRLHAFIDHTDDGAPPSDAARPTGNDRTPRTFSRTLVGLAVVAVFGAVGAAAFFAANHMEWTTQERRAELAASDAAASTIVPRPSPAPTTVPVPPPTESTPPAPPSSADAPPLTAVDDDFQGDGRPTEEIIELLGEEGAGTCPNSSLRRQLDEEWRIYTERAAADIEYYTGEGDLEIVARVEANLPAAQHQYDQAVAAIDSCQAPNWYWP